MRSDQRGRRPATDGCRDEWGRSVPANGADFDAWKVDGIRVEVGPDFGYALLTRDAARSAG